MNASKTQSIVFYGSKEQINLFAKNELDENGAFTVETLIHGTPVEIHVDTQRDADGESSYIKLIYEASDEIALQLAVYLMEDIQYLKSVAKIRNLSEKTETIFRHEERGFQECVELTNVEYKNGRAYGELTITEGFYEEMSDDFPLKSSFRWVGSPVGTSVRV